MSNLKICFKTYKLEQNAKILNKFSINMAQNSTEFGKKITELK